MQTKYTSIAQVPVALLKKFISRAQFRTILDGSNSEEHAFVDAKVVELANLFSTMPKTYDTNDMGDKAVAHLHYFLGGFDWFITERDMEEEQLQAFGLAIVHEAELGYISIAELISNGAIIDLHWTPKTIGEIKKEKNL